MNIVRIIFFLLAAALITACGNEAKKTKDKSATDTLIPKTGTAPQDTTPPQSGLYEKKYKNGQVSLRGEMRDGKREGTWFSYYEDGKLWSQGEYVNGQRNGKSISWYPNGQKRFEGNYTNEKQTGTWKYWDETGKLSQEVNYDQPTSK
jgi:antitoxin component YwqK of YwqJK toxin-antitoxin module